MTMITIYKVGNIHQSTIGKNSLKIYKYNC